MSARLDRRFETLRAERRAGLVVFVMAGDPDGATTAALLPALAAAGADVIELGLPAAEPVLDGGTIRAAARRARAGGFALESLFARIAAFRAADALTPLVLMGYRETVASPGPARFMTAAAAAGADAVLLADLAPPAPAFDAAAAAAGLALIRILGPETGDARLAEIVSGARGFLYYRTVEGATGGVAPGLDAIATGVARVRAHSPLPVAVGFGIRTPASARSVATIADAVVVGSALVEAMAVHVAADGRATDALVPAARAVVADLARAVRSARHGKAGAA